MNRGPNDEMTLWPIITGTSLPRCNPCIPECNSNDIGRRVIRGNVVSPTHIGWSAIGAVIEYIRAKENLVDDHGNEFESDDEITTNAEDLHEGGGADKWRILFGNGEVASLNVSDFIEGLQLYQRVANNEENMKILSIDPDMLLESSSPPEINTFSPTFTPLEPSVENFGCDKSDSDSVKEKEEISIVPFTNVDAVKCHICKSGDNEANMLLCDQCDLGYHLNCLDPPMDKVPEGDWFCDICLDLPKLKCRKCSKIFKSEGGYLYHAKNKICEDVTKKRSTNKANKKTKPKQKESIYEEYMAEAIQAKEEAVSESDEQSIEMLSAEVLDVANLNCSICNSGSNEENMLLCDRCDLGYHMNCLDPPLKALPEGNWFCANCKDKNGYTCKLCFKSFKTIFRYQSHMKNQICIKNDADDSKVNDDEDYSNDKPKKKRDRSRSGKPSRATCKICWESIASNANVSADRSMLADSNTSNEEITGAFESSDKNIVCKTCQSQFHYDCVKNATESIYTDGEEWECYLCSARVPANTCNLCQKHFETWGGYKYHMRQKPCLPLANLDTDDKDKCLICQLVDDSVKVLICDMCRHLVHSRCLAEANNGSLDEKSKYWYCSQCSNSNFPKCSNCGKLFRSMPGWVNHTKNVCKITGSTTKKESIREVASRGKRKRDQLMNEYDDNDSDNEKEKVLIKSSRTTKSPGSIYDTQDHSDSNNESEDSDSEEEDRTNAVKKPSRRDNRFIRTPIPEMIYAETIHTKVLDSLRIQQMNTSSDDDDIEILSLSEWIDKLKLVLELSDVSDDVKAQRTYLEMPNVTLSVNDLVYSTETTIYPLKAVKRLKSKKNSKNIGLREHDWFISAGGPVWTIDFTTKSHPDQYNDMDTSQESNLTETYMAVGLSRIGWQRKCENIFNRNLKEVFESGKEMEYDIGCDYKQFVNRKSSNPSLVEIWKYQQKSHNSEESYLTLQYLIGFANRGPVWQARWSSIEFQDDTVIGMISLVMGDGTCLILMVPRENLILRGNQIPTDSLSSDTPHDFENIKLIDGEELIIWELACINVRIMSSCWSYHDQWNIACGMSDGSICIWRLDSSQLSNGAGKATTLIPNKRLVDRSLNPFHSSRSSIRSIEYCPFDKDILVTGGYDTTVKFWNIHFPARPLKVTSPQGLGWIYDVQWELRGNGIFIGGSDRSTVHYSPIYPDQHTRHQLYDHTINHAGIWKLHVCRLNDMNTSTILSASSDGSIRYGCSKKLSDRDRKLKRDVNEPFRIEQIQDKGISPEDTNDTDQYQNICVSISTDQKNSTQSSKNNCLVDSPAYGMHCINTFRINEDTGVAYGGAMGLIRLHIV